MKLLMIFSSKFEYKTSINTLAEFKTDDLGKTYNDCLVAFIHAEEKDQEDIKSVEKKLVKNLKWAAKKNDTKNVLLHSFAHLSESKASPEITKDLFDKVEARMKNADYITNQTPFGYFLDLNVSAPGSSITRLFKSF